MLFLFFKREQSLFPLKYGLKGTIPIFSISEFLSFTPFVLIHIILRAMKKSSLEKAVESGASFLSKVFPLKSYLYFPLLNETLFWALKKAKEWKKE